MAPTTILLFSGSIAALLAGAVLPLAAGRDNRRAHRLGAGCCSIGSTLGIISAWQVLATGGHNLFSFYWESAGLPLTLNLDGLAAFFLLPVFFLTLVCCLYAVRYLDFPARGLQAARHWFAFNILAGAMAVVVAAADGLTFLLSWELMALSSFLLIVTGPQQEKTAKAGTLYLIATHLGAAFLFLLFLTGWYRTGSLDFTAFATLQASGPSVAVAVFIPALIGFGAKAGLFPFHVWLPEAHSAAPSHISALMSGIMIKTSIYAFLRMTTLLAPQPEWCGLLVAVLGLAGALFGIAMASLQTDIKRSLAYSTVENIGIIFLALGLWLYSRKTGDTITAGLALAGALLHIWNHALFKSLLFMGAGSISHGSGGTLEMSRLGGLMHRLPLTGILMVTGAAAVAALPPLNGLVSELLIYLSLIHAGQTATGGQAVLFLLCTVLLAMVGGMVLLTMTRLIGIVFGGSPRSKAACNAHEAPGSMLAAMAGVAFLCLALGVFPQAALYLLRQPYAILAPGLPGLAAILPLPFGAGWSLGMTTLLLVLAGSILFCVRMKRHDAGVPTWGCGFGPSAPAMEYTGGSYSQLSQDGIYCSCLRLSALRSGKNILFPAEMQFRLLGGDVVLDRLFRPLFVLGAEGASFCRRLQAGRINVYLTYMFLTTILLLAWNYLMFWEKLP